MLWMWGVVVFGIASAIEYFRKFWRKVDASIKHRRRRNCSESSASASAWQKPTLARIPKS